MTIDEATATLAAAVERSRFGTAALRRLMDELNHLQNCQIDAALVDDIARLRAERDKLREKVERIELMERVMARAASEEAKR